MKKKKRKTCELQEFGKNKCQMKFFGTPRSNSSNKSSMTIVVEGRQGDLLYSNFLHPMYSSNDNLRVNQENKKVKKKQTIFKRIQNIFSKNSKLKNENKNSKLQLPLKKYNDSFVLPHLQNTYITQNFTTSKISNTSTSEEASKTVDEINTIKDDKCEINTEKDIKPAEEIKEVRSKSEVGIQAVLDENATKSSRNSLLINSNIPGANNQEACEFLYKEQIDTSKTTLLETPERKSSSEKTHNQLANLPEDKTNVTSYDSINRILFKEHKPPLIQKTQSFESEKKSCSRVGSTEPYDGRRNCRSIHSISDNNEINSRRRWALNYEQNYLSSDSDDTFHKSKNTQYSLPESKEFEMLKEDYNNLSKSLIHNKEKNALKSHNNYSKTEVIFPRLKQTSENSFNQKISKKESSQSDRTFTPDYVSQKKLKCENSVAYISSKNDIGKQKAKEKTKIPLFSQPDDPIPSRLCCGPPRFIWSKAASPFNMEVGKIFNKLQQRSENVIAFALDSSSKLHSSFNNETNSGETRTNGSSEWLEEDNDSVGEHKQTTVIKASSLEQDTPSRLDAIKTTAFKNNFTDSKTFPSLSDDLNIFEKCRKIENDHSGLNISLQQFKDLKNNLCITLCSSTLYDEEHNIFKNAYNNLQFDENDFNLPNLVKTENSKAMDLMQSPKDLSERSLNTAKSIIGSTSTINNSYAASHNYKEIIQENVCLKEEQTNIKKFNISQSKQNVTTANSKQGMTANNYKRTTHINKLLEPGVKKPLPLNGFIKLNTNHEILNKGTKVNYLNANDKKKIHDSTNGKPSQRNMPHGAFSGNISGSIVKNSKSTKKTKKIK